MHLHEDVFQRIVAQEDKHRYLEQLETLFSAQDELWQLELPEPLCAWRYVKFYQSGVLFGIVYIGQVDYLRIVDWYFLKYDREAADKEEQGADRSTAEGMLVKKMKI